jgi:hypothetical protein
MNKLIREKMFIVLQNYMFFISASQNMRPLPHFSKPFFHTEAGLYEKEYWITSF